MKNNLKAWRATKHLTQVKLAELIGATRQTVNSIEASRYCPSTILALKIARVFEVPVERIFKLEETD